MCIVCISNNINRNVYMYLTTRIFPTTGYARVLLFMFIRRELGGMGTGCSFQFTNCECYNCNNLFMQNGQDRVNIVEVYLPIQHTVSGHYRGPPGGGGGSVLPCSLKIMH